MAAPAGAVLTPFAGSERVTIATRLPIIRLTNPYAQLFGSVAGGRSGEHVRIEGKACGGLSFRSSSLARPGPEGNWSAQALIQATTVFRARWEDAVSGLVTVRVRARVELERLGSRRFEVRVGGVQSFWRKRVVLERYDRRVGTWTAVRSIALSESHGSYASTVFRTTLPKGVLIRAALPLSQARPCYLAGVSIPVRA